ncbi:MAG TPA: MlaD family protein [Terriglobales bacterium]|nr:MlaD family protein [Terriglobales bacterium]
MPSQKQLRWSQLRVGLTVLCAGVTLAVLTFLMSGTTGLFTPKITLKSYFDNAQGLHNGAPVRLAGVDVGNVSGIRVVADRPRTPVEITMRVNTKYIRSLKKESVTSLSTAGVLGETFIDIDSSLAKGAEAQDGDTLATRDTPDIQDVVRASQGTLQNLDALLKRTDRILAYVESGQGSIGKLIYDPTLYNRFSDTVSEFKGIVDQVRSGQGSLGKLVASDEAYNKAIAAVDKLNAVIDDLQQGKGTAGKFLKDPSLYNNANETIANVKKLTDDINAGKGAIGKLTKDEVLAQKLDNTISKLSALTGRLEAGEGTAGMLFKDPALYNNTNQMLLETRQLVKSIREDPKKYLTFKVKVF